jgi:methanogenic corrinoid protein MtbC1
MAKSIELSSRTAEAIDSKRSEIASSVVELHYQSKPRLWQSYGQEGRRLCLRDIDYHLSYLIESLAGSDPSLFGEYLVWLQGLFDNIGLPERTVPDLLANLKQALKSFLAEKEYKFVAGLLDRAALSPEQPAPGSLGSWPDGQPVSPQARQYIEALLRGDRAHARRVILEASETGSSVQDIYLAILQPAQREIGRLWYQQKISVAEEHYCTAATQLIMSELYPRIFNTPKSGKRLVAACAEGELHEIGIRMVADFFEMDGWDTYYLGANMPIADTVRMVISKKPDVLALSATLSLRRSFAANLISRIKSSPEGSRLKIIVGGGAFSPYPDLYKEIGAHGSADDARGALKLVDRLLKTGGS